MCWDRNVSLATGTWGWLVAAWVWRRNRGPRDRWGALFLWTFASVQFVDAWFWHELARSDGACTDANLWVSMVGLPCVLALQPVASVVGARLARPRVHLPRFLVGVAAAYAGWIVTHHLWREPWDCTVVGRVSGHLVWMNRRISNDRYALFALLITLPFAWMRPRVAGLAHAGCIWAAWAAALPSESNGSFWCLWSNLYSLVLLADPGAYRDKER